MKPSSSLTNIDNVSPVLLIGVNPFEDVPGYHLLGLIGDSLGDKLYIADDSTPAIRVLSQMGTQIHFLPHPCWNEKLYLEAIASKCKELSIELLIPASDAHLCEIGRIVSNSGDILPNCPMVRVLIDNQMFNKYEMQDWLSAFGNVPERRKFKDESDLLWWGSHHSFPVMVKGMLKGAIRCEDISDARVARKKILENPANQGISGGTYLESYVSGEEHSILLVIGPNDGKQLASIGIKKLATTKMGTTVVAETEVVNSNAVDIDRITEILPRLTVIEIEYRVTDNGDVWLFESNFRFPSWIGATGQFGKSLLTVYVNSSVDMDGNVYCCSRPPSTGTLIYRLPESGILPLKDVFNRPLDPYRRELSNSPIKSNPLLWESSSPHQFLIK